MGLVTQAHVFVNGETLTAATMNANPQNFVNAFKNIDNTNIGAAGLFASQVIPLNVAQATFGGSVGYTFNPGSSTQVPLTISAPSGQSVDIFDVTLNSVKELSVGSTGVVNFAQKPTITGSGSVAVTGSDNMFSSNQTISTGNFLVNDGIVAASFSGSPGLGTPGDLITCRSSSTGAVQFGASNGTHSIIDWGVTTSSWFTFSNSSGTLFPINASNGQFGNSAFSSPSTTYFVGVGTPGTLNSGGFLIANNSTPGASFKYTEVLAAGDTVGSIAGTAFEIIDRGNAVLLAMNTAGSMAIAGNLQSAALSNSTTTVSYVPPCYTSAGAAVSSTFHIVSGTATITNGNTLVAVTLTNAAVFASGTYVLVATADSSALAVQGVRNSGSSFQLALGAASVGSTNIDWIAIGA